MSAVRVITSVTGYIFFFMLNSRGSDGVAHSCNGLYSPPNLCKCSLQKKKKKVVFCYVEIIIWRNSAPAGSDVHDQSLFSFSTKC